jgi:hypothetical protein
MASTRLPPNDQITEARELPSGLIGAADDAETATEDDT